MRKCNVRKCENLVMNGFRRCVQCIRGIKTVKELEEEE